MALITVTVFPAEAPAARGDTGQVESRLILNADRSGEMGASVETRMRALASLGSLPDFFEAAVGSEKWRRGKAFLDSDLGLFPSRWESDKPWSVAIEHGELVAASRVEESGVSTIRDGTLRSDVGPFQIVWGDGLRVRTREPRMSPRLDWIVVLDLDQVQVESTTPEPTALTRDGAGTIVKWRFPAERGAERVDAELTPPWAVRLNLDMRVHSWSGLAGTVYVIFALSFLPVLFLLLRRDDLRDDSPSGLVLRHQVSWLLAAAAFAVLTTVSALLRSHLMSLDYVELPALNRIVVDLTPMLTAVACIGSIFAAGQKTGAWRRLRPAWIFIAVTFVLVATVAETVESDALVWLQALVTFMAIACLLVLLYWLVNGFLRVFLHWIVRRDEEAEMSAVWRWRAAVFSTVVVLGAITASFIVYLSRNPTLFAVATIEIPNTLINTIFAGAPLLPVALLPAAASLLRNVDSPRPFLIQHRGLWLVAVALYLFFVVPVNGMLAGFSAPIPLLLATVAVAVVGGFRMVMLERLESEVAHRNPGASVDESPLLTGHRRELIDRAFLIRHLRHLRAGAHQKQAKNEEAGAFVDYRKRLVELEGAERYLQTGDPPPGVRPSAGDNHLVDLKFPSEPSILYPAMSCGPGKDWQENGRIAFHEGLAIAALPIFYFVFVLARHNFDSIFSPYYGLELINVVGLIAGEVTLWLIAAYTFGCLFTWLPGGNGAIKGPILALPAIAAVGLGALCPLYAGQADWVFRCFELLFFLGLLGLRMDVRTVHAAGLRLRDLFGIYQIRSFRFGIINLIPLLIAVLGIYRELRMGNPQHAVEEALKIRGQE